MKITSLILIAALGTPILATPDRSDKDHHKQTYARQQFNGGLRKLLHEEHLPTQSRIVDGLDAAVGQFPFFVDWSGCGASLIHKDIILTAAHCFGVGTNTVYVGSSRRYGGVADRGIERTITKKNIHPLYDDRTVNYDYLVMKLNAPVDGITPVQLNDEGTSPFNNEKLTVIGYGATEEGGSGTSVLQEANVNYIPTGNCNVNYSGEINGATMMCAGVGGGIDSCQGDSGGPIFIENDDDTFKQVGIVSWGYGCARPEYPGVYSRVSGQVDWIKAQICALSDFKPDYCNASDDGGDGDSDGGAGEGEVTVRFDITYDEYPTENSWSVQKGQTTVINKNVGELTIAGLVSEKFKLSSGSHTFQINDSFSDGICCAFGQGRYEIYAEIGGTDVLLLSSAGDFGALDRKEFIVPGANGSPSASAPTPAAATPAPTRASREPTSAPTPDATPAPTPEAATLAPTPVVATPAPTESPVAEQPPLGCTDSATPMSIFINDVVGTQDCSWLGDNLNNFSYLCRFLDVAAACKVTCSACQYFVN